jgi:hypothetical protein
MVHPLTIDTVCFTRTAPTVTFAYMQQRQHGQKGLNSKTINFLNCHHPLVGSNSLQAKSNVKCSPNLQGCSRSAKGVRRFHRPGLYCTALHCTARLSILMIIGDTIRQSPHPAPAKDALSDCALLTSSTHHTHNALWYNIREG